MPERDRNNRTASQRDATGRDANRGRGRKQRLRAVFPILQSSARAPSGPKIVKALRRAVVKTTVGINAPVPKKGARRTSVRIQEDGE